ncbi:MAG: ABC transporter permease [Pseudomonadota bacterium]
MNAPTDSRAVLKVRGLHVHYGASHALQGVNIELSEGVHSVLGRNGMGKTTLCNAVMGMVPASSGSVRFEGQELVGKSSHQIAKLGVGYTPQRRRLWPSLTVDEHLRLCAVRGSPWTPERIYDSFPRLAERKNNGGAQLSGGEQQMLAISRALLPNPRLLVMDEPTEGLAPVIVDQVVDMLGRIAGEGDVAILLVEQNIAVATAVAEDCAIMVNGRISTVINAAKLSTDRALQQRLLGVGRQADVAELAPRASTGSAASEPAATKTSAPEAPPPVTAPAGSWRYVPPKRWSADHWNGEAAKDIGPMGTAAASVLPARDNMGGHVVVAGTFDTKATELGFIKDRLLAQGLPVRTVDLSTSGKPSSADVPPHHIAVWHPGGTGSVFTGDRGSAVAGMTTAFERWASQTTGIAGMISACGSGGTALTSPAMRALPLGVPKVLISTVASGEVSQYVGPSDIMMMYSVTDIQGINKISAKVLANGADALAGAVKFSRENAPTVPAGKPALGLTMFGVTTPAVQRVIQLLEHSYECLVFHATGVGGRSMEKLADNGFLSGALDLTTTEIADFVCGGVFSADEDRFGAFIRHPMPYVGSVGAVDMCNFGPPETVPEKYAHRQLYPHNPQVTIMRTTAEENTQIGNFIAGRMNEMPGPVRYLLPLKGVSAMDAEGRPFHNPLATGALFEAIRKTFQQTDTHQLIELDCHINDPAFAEAAAGAFQEISGLKEEARHA